MISLASKDEKYFVTALALTYDYKSVVLCENIFGRRFCNGVTFVFDIIEVPVDGMVYVVNGTRQVHGAAKVGGDLFDRQ